MTVPGPERISVTAARWALGGATALLVGLASGATALIVVTSTTGAQLPLDEPRSLPYATAPREPRAADVLLLPAGSPSATSGAGGRPRLDEPPRNPPAVLQAPAAPRRTTGDTNRKGPTTSAPEPGTAEPADTDRPGVSAGTATDGPTGKGPGQPTAEPHEEPTSKPTAEPTQPTGGPETGEPEQPSSRTPAPGSTSPTGDAEREKDKRDKDDERDDRRPRDDREPPRDR